MVYGAPQGARRAPKIAAVAGDHHVHGSGDRIFTGEAEPSMENVTIVVPDILCDHCRMSLEGTVGELAGLSQVNVTIDVHTIDLTFDEGLTSVGDIVGAVEGQGYEVLESPV
jgi:copper chaperone